MAPPEAKPKIFRRDVKHPRLEFRRGALEVILPPGDDAAMLMKKKQQWINKKTDFINECLERAREKQLVTRTDADLRSLVYGFVEIAAGDLGVEVNTIRFRHMKTKWASCSNKRNLTFNSLMKYLPNELVDYIVFHETAHIREKRHNDRFWQNIYHKFERYSELEKDLFSYWFLVHSDMAQNDERGASLRPSVV